MMDLNLQLVTGNERRRRRSIARSTLTRNTRKRIKDKKKARNNKSNKKLENKIKGSQKQKQRKKKNKKKKVRKNISKKKLKNQMKRNKKQKKSNLTKQARCISDANKEQAEKDAKRARNREKQARLTAIIVKVLNSKLDNSANGVFSNAATFVGQFTNNGTTQCGNSDEAIKAFKLLNNCTSSVLDFCKIEIDISFRKSKSSKKQFVKKLALKT